MVIWPVIHLATSAASGYMLTTENDLPYNYWLEQLYFMFQLTWKCLQLRLFTGDFTTYIFPNISMVNKPTQTLLGYSNIWSTNNSYNNFLYLIWSTIRGERTSQKLIDYNYTPIGPIGTEMSWALIFLDFPIGDNIKKLCIFFQATFALVVSPAKWSVSQPLNNPDVGSSKPFCRPTFTL